jgi:hypothetical protein
MQGYKGYKGYEGYEQIKDTKKIYTYPKVINSLEPKIKKKYINLKIDEIKKKYYNNIHTILSNNNNRLSIKNKERIKVAKEKLKEVSRNNLAFQEGINKSVKIPIKGKIIR